MIDVRMELIDLNQNLLKKRKQNATEKRTGVT